MGRYYWSKKSEADSLKKIQVWWLKKHGYLDGGWRVGRIKWTNSWSGDESSVSFHISIYDYENYLRLIYTKTKDDGSKQNFDYKIPFTTTLCYFGGKRYWFICPWYASGIYCGRRVGVLYLDGDYFACRTCYDLSYSSRNKSKNKLGWAIDLVFKSDEIAEKKANLRVKSWRGKPTKKYRKLDQKEQRALGGMYMASHIIEGIGKDRG